MDRVGALDDQTVSKEKLVLRPLIGLLRGLNPKEIEPFVVEEIEKHRRLRDEAVKIEMLLESEIEDTKRIQTNKAYISAMIAVHAQQTVVSTLLDILGYIPEMPKRKPH